MRKRRVLTLMYFDWEIKYLINSFSLTAYTGHIGYTYEQQEL